MKTIKLALINVLILAGVINLISGGNQTMIISQTAYGHCDTEDGPVVKAAKKALESGNVEIILPWVKKEDETKVKHVFEDAVKVRKLSPEAKTVADRYFIETVVRIHRVGEGESFEGVKPAGATIEPGILIADKAVESGNDEELIKTISNLVLQGISMRFKDLMKKQKNKNKDVQSGREFVESYVEFIHYVEKVYSTIVNEDESHSPGKTNLHNEHHKN